MSRRLREEMQKLSERNTDENNFCQIYYKMQVGLEIKDFI